MRSPIFFFWLLPVIFLMPFASTGNVGPDQNKSDGTIKIGLLVRDDKSRSASNGAELAIRKANERGGYNGRPFTLVIRSIEGPWGAGSREAVNLIFDDKVCAIMGSLDDRNAHLVEQVCAKERILFLSAWATDPALSQAFVPWYFSCVPNDLQQADALIDEIYKQRNLSRITVISDNDYDAKLALSGFVKRAKAAGKPAPSELYYDSAAPDFNDLVARIGKLDTRAVVLFGQPPASLKLLELMHRRKMNQVVFGTLNFSGDDNFMHESGQLENMVSVCSGQQFSSRGQAFGKDFRKIYGYNPDAVAAFSYDGMSILLEAISKSGTEYDKIQMALAKMNLDGVTGTVSFDGKGNRTGKVFLMEVKNGHPHEAGIH